MTEILIVAATVEEARFLLRKKREPLPGKAWPLDWIKGPMHFDLLITGPGITFTAWHLAKALSMKRYDLAINIGIAGSSDPAIQPVRVVQVRTDRFADWGAENEKGAIIDGFGLGFLSPNKKPFKAGVLQATFKGKLSCLKAIPSVAGITVNTATGTEKRKRMLVDQYGEGIESMEGAAFLYGCAMEGIPALQIRSVSNKTGKRNRKAWKVREAIDALEGFVGLMIMELSSQKQK